MFPHPRLPTRRPCRRLHPAWNHRGWQDRATFWAAYSFPFQPYRGPEDRTLTTKESATQERQTDTQDMKDEGLKFRVIISYIVNLRPVWTSHFILPAQK